MKLISSRNLGLDLVRATEAAALAAGRWMGLDKQDEADAEAAVAMFGILDTLDIDGDIVVGEEGRLGKHSPLDAGQKVGTGNGPALDVVADPIEGRKLLAQGRSGAIAVAAVSPLGSLWAPRPALYMEKIVVNQRVAAALVPECLDAPAAWTLALVARIKQKPVRDLEVFILDRPRHHALIEEIRRAGARVMLRAAGDVSGALLAASADNRVDILLGTGGMAEGIISACAVRALGGAMLGRLAPQSDAERAAIQAAGYDTRRILNAHEMVTSNQVFFAATGISDGPLLAGVRYHGDRAETHSLILRGETGTRRLVYAEHAIQTT